MSRSTGHQPASWYPPTPRTDTRPDVTATTSASSSSTPSRKISRRIYDRISTIGHHSSWRSSRGAGSRSSSPTSPTASSPTRFSRLPPFRIRVAVPHWSTRSTCSAPTIQAPTSPTPGDSPVCPKCTWPMPFGLCCDVESRRPSSAEIKDGPSCPRSSAGTNSPAFPTSRPRCWLVASDDADESSDRFRSSSAVAQVIPYHVLHQCLARVQTTRQRPFAMSGRSPQSVGFRWSLCPNCAPKRETPRLPSMEARRFPSSAGWSRGDSNP